MLYESTLPQEKISAISHSFVPSLRLARVITVATLSNHCILSFSKALKNQARRFVYMDLLGEASLHVFFL